LEISFVDTFRLIDVATGATLRGKANGYITAGNSGVATFDLREIFGKGKQYVRFSVCIDDGFTAGGAVNYIRYVWIDGKEDAAAPSIAASNTTSKPTTTTTTTVATTAATTTAASSEVDPVESEETVSNEETSATADANVNSEANTSEAVSDVPTDVPGGNEKPKNEFPVGIVVAIVAAVVVIGGGVAAFLILKKKKSAAPDEQA